MELIPILSTIILVATISTFLLAIGAYILYKARERRGQIAVEPRQAEIRAEIVTPAGMPVQRQEEQQRAERQPIIIQQVPAQQQRYTQGPQPYNAYRQQQPSGPNVQQPGQYNEAGYVQQRGFQAPQQGTRSEENAQKKDSKFLKYTTEGYVPAKENKDSGAVRWR